MKKSLPSVTVAISAYNEEQNIRAFLESVLLQKEKGFILKKIWVYMDGSLDKTVVCAKAVKSAKIKIFAFRKRIGKSSRLNQIYKKLTSDILVQADADVVLTHPYVIVDMIRPLVESKNVMMSGGNPVPVPGTTFIERAVNYTFDTYAPLRRILRDGNNIFSADGRMLAYKKEFLKNIQIPITMIGNDIYTYFCCLALGYKYVHVPSAIVNFRSPQSIKDQIRQNTRFLSARERMLDYFDKKLVIREFYIPRGLLFRLRIKEFVKHPFSCMVIFMINTYCRFRAGLVGSQMTALWKMAVSTKLLAIGASNTE